MIKGCTEGAGEAITKINESAKDLAESIFSGSQGIAEKFKTGKITTTFVEDLPKIVTSEGNNMEVAVLEITETLREQSVIKYFWGVYGEENIIEIKVPVTFRYYINLLDPWQLETQNQTCIVTAPEIKPFLPPAIHTDKMEKLILKEGWISSAEKKLDNLERKITPYLIEKAGRPDRIESVKETARKKIAEFVKVWLLKEDHWRENRFNTIIVQFPDEIKENSKGLRLTPSLKLEQP